MLWIALDFPCLPLDTFALASAHTEPWAIADGTDVLVCNAAARALGVRDGMRLSAACALAPQLNYRLRDAAAENAALATLAAWANQFTPNVSLEPPRALLLDIEGSLRFFGGIRPILQALKRGLDEMGYAATMACAPTATAALLLARARMQKIVNCKRALEAVVATLPLTALDCDARTAQTLHAVGVKHVAELMALPRDGLARRCGRQLLDTVDRALGRLPAPRQFLRPARAVHRQTRTRRTGRAQRSSAVRGQAPDQSAHGFSGGAQWRRAAFHLDAHARTQRGHTH